MEQSLQGPLTTREAARNTREKKACGSVRPVQLPQTTGAGLYVWRLGKTEQSPNLICSLLLNSGMHYLALFGDLPVLLLWAQSSYDTLPSSKTFQGSMLRINLLSTRTQTLLPLSPDC